MGNILIPSATARWTPDNQSKHEDDGDVFIKVISDRVKHESKPTITHGTTSGWSDYELLQQGNKTGNGIFETDYGRGSLYCSWGSSGSKHTEIMKYGYYNDSRWLPYVKGCGFKVFRHRTDSTSFTNDNANQHCIFLKRFGIRFKHRTNNQWRFWSSDVLATHGEATERTFPYASGVGTHEFYQCRDTGFDNYRDWLLESFWVNLASRDTSKVGTATTKVYLYDLRFYHDAQCGKNRMMQPAFRDAAARNEPMFGP